MSRAFADRLYLTSLVPWIGVIDRESLRADLRAGCIGGVLVLPQAVAFATIAGMPPEYGVYTMIIPVLIAAFFGSSHHAMGGPNTALAIITYEIVGHYATPFIPDYIMYVITLTFMVGVMQIILGLLRVSVIFDYFSQAAMTAIIAGVGISGIINQSGTFLGITMNASEYLEDTAYRMLATLSQTNIAALFIATVTLVAGLYTKRHHPKAPAIVVAMVVGTIAGKILDLFIGPAISDMERLGLITTRALPLSAPNFAPADFSLVQEGFFPGAFVLAFMGLMQSCVIARSMALRSGQKVNINREALGQGVSNVVGSFFSCFPSASSFNRSDINFAAGARTPLSSIISAFVLVGIVILARGVIADMPMAVMAGVLFMVGLQLINAGRVAQLLRIDRDARIVFPIVLFSSLYGGIRTGVAVGIGISIVTYFMRASRIEVQLVQGSSARPFIPGGLGVDECTVVRIAFSLFFGTVHDAKAYLNEISRVDQNRTHLVVSLETVHHVDEAAIELLLAEAQARKKAGKSFYLWLSVDNPINARFENEAVLDVIGRDHVLYR